MASKNIQRSDFELMIRYRLSLMCNVNGTLYIITCPKAPDCLTLTLRKANKELIPTLILNPI